MPQPGEIIQYKDYIFEDGSKGDKLFVVLNATDLNSPCLILKTTSQQKRYENAIKGCNPQKKVFFVPAGSGECFKVDTYIQLPQIIEISTKELLQGTLSNKNIHAISSLSTNCLAQLKNCLRKFAKDISERHRRLIF